MGIHQYWCPEHHTTKRSTRLDKFTFYENEHYYNRTWNKIPLKIFKARFIHITPVCQICKKEMIYAGSNLPKKTKKCKKV